MSTERDQKSAITMKASDYVTQVRRLLDSMEVTLDEPGRDSPHAYAELVRLTARIRDVSSIYGDGIALAAHQQPARVSLRRLSGNLGRSVNYLRARLQAQAAEAADTTADRDDEVTTNV